MSIFRSVRPRTPLVVLMLGLIMSPLAKAEEASTEQEQSSEKQLSKEHPSEKQLSKNQSSEKQPDTEHLSSQLPSPEQLKVSGISKQAKTPATLDSSALSILLKELELQRLSIRFMLNSVSKGRWKGWRYFSFQEANAALIEAGLITAIDQRFLQIHHHGTANITHLENSLMPQMIGQCVGVLGDATEVGVNAGHSIRAHELELDQAAVKRRALKLQSEISESIANHKVIPTGDLVGASAVNATEIKALYDKELQVLEDLQQLTWIRFCTFSTTLRRLNVTQNIFYALDIMKNASGATGAGLGLMSLHKNRPILGVPANILITVSGVFIMTDPLSSQAIGKFVAARHNRGFVVSTPAEREAAYFRLCNDVRIMKSLAAQLDTRRASELSALLRRIKVYEQHEDQFAQYVRELQEERQKAYTAALSQAEVAGFVGGTKATSGILGIIASDRYPTRPVSAGPLQLGAAVTYAPGMALALGVNLDLEVRREITYQKNKKHNRLPRQILSSQLSKLDDMEASIKTLNQ
jgi:hypothetical protein